MKGDTMDEEVRTRERRTNKYDDTLATFHDNLIAITTDNVRPVSQAEIARAIGVPKTAVARWMGGKGLPTVDQLVILSEYFDVDPGWMISKHKFGDILKFDITYYNAAVVLKKLVDLGAVEQSAITDYFLSYLVKRLGDIEARDNVAADKKNRWTRKIAGDYNVPVLPSQSYEYFAGMEAQFGDIYDDDTHLSILHAYMESCARYNTERENLRRWIDGNSKGSSGSDLPFE